MIMPSRNSSPGGALRALVLVALCALPLTGAPPATAAAPTITAPSAAVIEPSTGTVVYTKNANQQRGMASTTKLMTALVALDEAPLGTVYSAIDYGGSAAETRLGLSAGEKMTLADLVRAMMLPSANDAAQTVAVRVGGSKTKFAALMNAKAKDLGLKRTRFANAIGLDAPGHRTTALELAKIGAAAHENPFLRAVVKKRQLTLESGAMRRTLVNRNRVLGTALPGGGVIDGMKTGHTTSSGYALVGSATRNGVTVVSAVLGDPSEATRDADTVRLLRWASQLFVNRTVVRERQRVAVIPVAHGKSETVSAVAPEALRRVTPRAATVELRPAAMSPGLEAPVAAGTPVGTAQVYVNDELVDTVPLVTRVAIERQGTVAALAEGARDNWTAVLLALLLVIGGTLTLARALRSGHPVPHPRAPAPPEPTERTTAP